MGTCSWKYDSWDGLVYSSSKPENYLQEYAEKFNSVEIDQWFWSLYKKDKITLPKPDIVKAYADSVPDDFRFTIKVPNSLTLTHYYTKSKTEPLLDNPFFLSADVFNQFIDALEPILPKVGALIFQFEYLNIKKMASQHQFLEKMNKFLEGVHSKQGICIETRNPNYLNQQYFQFLNEKGLGHTFCQGYYMPHIVDVFNRNRDFIKGTNVIRLLGADRQGIEKTTENKWDNVVSPKDTEIMHISNMINVLSAQDGVELYVNVNNHYEGSAPKTIQKLNLALNLV